MLEPQRAGVAVGKGVTPLPPAQIPACGFLAPGSSDSLASASPTAIPLREVDTPPALLVRLGVPFEGYGRPSVPSPCDRPYRLVGA